MKKFYRYVVIGLAMILVGAAVLIGLRAYEFNSKIAELKKNGFHVSFADLNKSNGFNVDAANYMKQLAVPLGKFEAEMYSDVEVLDRPVDAEMVGRFSDLIDRFPLVYPLLSSMSNADGYTRPEIQGVQDINSIFMPEFDRFRSCTRVLAWKTRVQAHDDKPDEAARTSLEALRLIRLMEEEPGLIAFLIGVFNRNLTIHSLHDVVASHDLSEETYRSINEELEKHCALGKTFKAALIGERAFGIERFSKDGFASKQLRGLGYLAAMESCINDAELPEYQRIAANSSKQSSNEFGIGGMEIAPSVDAVRDSKNRVQSLINSLRIIVALHESKTPEDTVVDVGILKAIGVPGDLTIDPMNGKPMKVLREDGQWKVYSVGADGRDDGGDPHPSRDYVLGGKPWEPGK